MNCIVCKNEFEPTRSDAKYCSDKCRIKANRNKTSGIPVTKEVNVTDNHAGSVTDNKGVIIDCNGMPHPIDYSRRKADFLQILDWAEGKGDTYQQGLGVLSCQYTKAHKVNLAAYLGMGEQEADKIRLRFDAIISRPENIHNAH